MKNTNNYEKLKNNFTMENMIEPTEYCPICNEPTKGFVKLPLGGSFETKMKCECKTSLEEAKRKIKELQKKVEHIEEMKEYAFPAKYMWEYTIENDDNMKPDVKQFTINYINTYKENDKNQKGLIITGETGVGKTFMSCQIANALIEKNIPVYMNTLLELVCDYNCTYYKNKFLADLKNNELIIIDEFNIEEILNRNASLEIQDIFDIINTIYNNGITLIITSNLKENYFNSNEKENQSVEYRRILDRITEKTKRITINGANRRKR